MSKQEIEGKESTGKNLNNPLLCQTQSLIGYVYVGTKTKVSQID